jgi:predicted nucleotidyltransferase
MSHSNGSNDQQATPADVLRLLEVMNENGIEVLVHGGWAIDAISGSTRPHSDIDLLVDEKHRQAVRKLFENDIVTETTHKLEVGFGKTTVDIVFFERRGKGFATITPRIIVLWPPNLLSDRRMARLNGTEIPIVSPRVLYSELANTVRKKAPMLTKNQRDLKIIAPYLTDADKVSKRYFPRPNTFWNRVRLNLGML